MGLTLFAAASGMGSPSHQPRASAGSDPRIEHRPSPCMDSEEFPLIEARISGPGEPRGGSHLTVHFKTEEARDWYEIALEPTSSGSFQAALPKPLPDAGRVVYYITSTKPELRSDSYLVEVLMGGCPGARSTSELSEEIRVRRPSSRQDPIPPGFQPDGIRSGGPSSRATLGIIAGAAGGAGVAAVLVANGETAPGNPGTGNPQALRACFTPDPVPDIESGDTVLFDATCTTPSSVNSFQWSFGDGSAPGQGSSVEHLFRPGGIYNVTLTVSDGQRTDSTSRLVHAIATPIACFITTPDPPRIRVNESISLNAECSVGDRDGGSVPIEVYAWDFGDGDDGGEGRFVSHLFTEPDLYGVTLMVTNADGRQDKTTQFVVVERRASGGRPQVTLTSALELPPGSRAQLFLNDAETIPASAPSPQRLRVNAVSGENILEGRLLGEAGEPGRWRIDFREARSFVAGSLRVDSGQVVAIDAYSVVFQLSGKPDAPIRFRFRLEE